jgi:hypothetical protein
MGFTGRSGTVIGMAIGTSPSFQWSELARRSADVGAALDEFGEVSVLRGSQALRLGPPDSPEVLQVFRDLCRLLSSMVTSDTPEHVTSILEMAWPWTRALPAKEQLELVAEVGRVAEMSESLGTWRPLLEVLADWRRTARAWADGFVPLTPLEIDEVLHAERPEP